MNAIRTAQKVKVFDLMIAGIKNGQDEGRPLSFDDIGRLFIAATERVVFG